MRDEEQTAQDEGQYGRQSLNRYEWIFGTDFLSSGAQEFAHHAAQSLDLRAECCVLDVGSGLGGAAFIFSESYAAKVTGLDVLPQMVVEAQRRARERRTGDVEFVLGDVLTVTLPAESFDAVYSKDSFLHIHDKRGLMRTLFRLLAHGGRVFFSDYLRGAEQGSDEFESYAAESGYSLSTSAHYNAAMRDAGFDAIIHEDRTNRLIEILLGDIDKLRSADAALRCVSAYDIDYLTARWELKLRCLRSGDMKWGSFAARRPA